MRCFVLSAVGMAAFAYSTSLFADTAPSTFPRGSAFESRSTVPAPRLPTSKGPLTIAVGDGVSKDGINRVVYRFGTLEIAPSSLITHDFTLRNTSRSAVDIERVVTSCGCTSAATNGGVAGVSSILPGKSLRLHVSIDPSHVAAGKVDKMVWIYERGSADPIAQIRMEGVLYEPISFDPPTLDFGRIDRTASPSLKVKMLLDGVKYTASTPDPIVTCPGARIVRDHDVPRRATPGRMVTRTYTVTLKPSSRLGLIKGYVKLANAPATPGAMVWAIITGDVSVKPDTVAFGAVPLGKTRSEHIVITGSSARLLQNLDAHSASGDVTVKIERPRSLDRRIWSSTVHLYFKPTRSGAFESNVDFKTSSGQVLELPVFGWGNAEL